MTGSAPAQWAISAIGLAWLVLFSAFFLTFDLPNNRPVTRWQVWEAMPATLMNAVWPLPVADAPPAGWKFFPQRLPAILTAVAILIAAIGYGSLFLRRLQLAAEMNRCEQLAFAGGIGLSLWSLMTLGLGLVGALHPSLVWILCGIGIAAAIWSARTSLCEATLVTGSPSRLLQGMILALAGILMWSMVLGAATPQTDFDVLAYHLNGPKEWFQQGRITFLPHNVYTSFPFLTEMLLLSGMTALGDWHAGALAGQIVLMTFAPLTALGVFAAGRRWFNSTAGWLAALVWLTTPWTYRISIIAYAEGGFSFYLAASFFAVCRCATATQHRLAWFLITGFLAGSAMACKYPGLISVVLPIGLGLAVVLIRQRTSLTLIGKSAAIYGLGVLIAVGPWLLKNTLETGNPVYPLAYSVFGGRDLDDELHAKWSHGHAAKTYNSLSSRAADLVRKFTDVIANNDWHSPLLYGLAPLSLWWMSRRGWLAAAWLYLGWLFLTWFVLTHHIDRFWIPMIPIVSLLAGAGAATLAQPFVRWVAGVIIAALIGFNLTISLLIGGYNSGLTDLHVADRIAANAMTPELRWLNEEWLAGRLPADFKLLCVGEAATFHTRFPVVYNAVFDQCLLEEWCAAGPGPDFPLRSADEIRTTLREHGVTHVFIDWQWIATYREPGNYGYTDFVNPRRIRSLQDLGILGLQLPLPPELAFASLTDQRAQSLETWAPELIVRRNGEPAYRAAQVFPVQ